MSLDPEIGLKFRTKQMAELSKAFNKALGPKNFTYAGLSNLSADLTINFIEPCSSIDKKDDSITRNICQLLPARTYRPRSDPIDVMYTMFVSRIHVADSAGRNHEQLEHRRRACEACGVSRGVCDADD